MIAEKLHCLVAERVLVSDMVGLVNDNQVETRRRIEIQETFFPFPLSFRRRAIKKRFIEQGVRDDDFLMLVRPNPVKIHFVDAISKGCAIKMVKALLEAFHLVQPLFLGDQRARGKQ